MRRICVVVLVLAAAGCASLGPDPSERILGRWSGEIGGYPVVVSYAEEMVTVDGADPVAYTLNGNELTFEGGGSQVRLVSFPARDRMVQTDPMTGTEQVFTRAD